MNDYMKNFNDTISFLKEKVEVMPEVAIVLGSGLGSLVEEIENKIVIPYKDIPHFPISTVKGHKRELIFGTLEGVPIIAMNGRFHYYEGYNLQEVAYPIRTFKLLGIKTLILTNAAGGINVDFQKGDLMIINDQLSFFAESVLRGPNIEEFGERFIDMSNVYNKDYIEVLKQAMKNVSGSYKIGVYVYMKGPTYETPAEIRALRTLGADAVGMSTVPEAVVAAHCGIKCVGISCITNMAAGVTNEILSHQDVHDTAILTETKFKKTIREFIKLIKK